MVNRNESGRSPRQRKMNEIITPVALSQGQIKELQEEFSRQVESNHALEREKNDYVSRMDDAVQELEKYKSQAAELNVMIKIPDFRSTFLFSTFAFLDSPQSFGHFVAILRSMLGKDGENGIPKEFKTLT